MNQLTLFALVLLVVGGCSVAPSDVGAVDSRGEATAQGSAALTVGTIQWIDGTYGGSCASRSGNWSLRVSGVAAMDYSALTVVMDNTACVLTLTKIVADQTYSTVSPIAMTTSYAGSASKFTGSSGLAFYANALLSSASFASTFTVTVLYSDNPSLGTGSLGTGYASVSSTSSTTSGSAPNYTLDLTTGAFTAVVSDTTSSVSSVSGTANLVLGSIAGGGYYVDQGTLAASPTFSQLDTAYTAATTTSISGSPVQIPASAFGLTGVNISSAVVRTIVIQRNLSGVHSYQTFAVTFNCGGACGVCPSGESSKSDSSGMSAANVCCATASTTLNCNGTCIDTQVDANNCGSCGNVCSAATPVCSSGSCIASCPTGSTLCSGVCVNVNSDNGNCGSCGNACSTGLGEMCQSGSCQVYCPSTSNDLSGIGTGDFSISFTVTDTGSGSTQSLINQRSACTTTSFWDVRITSAGFLQVETTDGTNDTSVTATTGVVNDGNLHLVTIQQNSQILTVFVDGVSVSWTQTTANWTAQLPALQTGTGCNGTNSLATVGSVCINSGATTAPIADGTYEFLDDPGFALNDPSAGGAGTSITQSLYTGTSTNQLWTVTRVSGSTYKIVATSGSALTGSSTIDTQLKLATYAGSQQQWLFVPYSHYRNPVLQYFIINTSNVPEVMDDYAGGGPNGPVYQWAWNNTSFTPNQAWNVIPRSTVTPPLSNGSYVITSPIGYALDDPSGGASAVPDNALSTGNNQKWTLTQVSGLEYKIIASSGAALTAAGSSGTMAALSTYTGATTQLWVLQPYYSHYSIVNVGSSDLALDYGTGASATSVKSATYNNHNLSQWWSVTSSTPTAPIANGIYSITDTGGFALDDPSGGATAVPDQVVYAGANQKWTITLVQNTWYKIIASSGAALTAGASTGTIAALSAYTGATSQLWTFQQSGSYYVLVNVGSSLVLDDSSATSGTQCQQNTFNPTSGGQLWTLTSR